MPAVVKSTEGSFSGIREDDGIIACPLDAKKLRYLSLNSYDFIINILYIHILHFAIIYGQLLYISVIDSDRCTASTYAIKMAGTDGGVYNSIHFNFTFIYIALIGGLHTAGRAARRFGS